MITTMITTQANSLIKPPPPLFCCSSSTTMAMFLFALVIGSKGQVETVKILVGLADRGHDQGRDVGDADIGLDIREEGLEARIGAGHPDLGVHHADRFDEDRSVLALALGTAGGLAPRLGPPPAQGGGVYPQPGGRG